MTNDEILDIINTYLDQHVNGVRGHIRQEPYIGDFFTLFVAAHLNRHSNSRITGDGLVEALSERAGRDDGSNRHTKKIELLRKLGAMWDEWDYAWEKYPHYNPRRER